MKNIGISVMGGTAVSIENSDNLREPSKEGLKIIEEKALKLLEKKGFNFSYVGEKLFIDSACLSTEQRNQSFKADIEYLFQPDNLGVVKIHGTGKLQRTAAMGWWGVKLQRKPIIITGSKDPANKENSQIIRHVQGSIRIIGSKKAPSIMGIYFYDRLMTLPARLYNFHTHDVYFPPSSIQRPVGIMKRGKYKPINRGYNPRYLDSTIVNSHEKIGNVRPPVIQKYRDWYTLRSIIDPMEIFLAEFALLMNNIHNSDEESREKIWYPKFWNLVKEYNVNGERLFKSFEKLKGQYYEPFFDIESVAAIPYDDIPTSHIEDIENNVFKGVVMICSGDGELNLSSSKKSHISLLNAFKKHEIPFVITPISSTPYSFRYQPELIVKYGGIGGGFKRSDELQVKLSKLVHQKVESMEKEVSEHYGVPIPILKHIMIEGGSEFRQGERIKYVQMTKVPTLVDLMDTNFPIELGLNLAGEYGSKVLNDKKCQSCLQYVRK
jgi:L-asparaginase/Glu-tRNA(Gln) amidotransferase subunit D